MSVIDNPAPAPRAARRRLLLVDDHAVVRQGLGLLLSMNFDFDVVEASRPSEALRLAEDPQVAVALVDVRLGDADGLALLADLQERRPDLPVLMLSTYASPELVRGAVDGKARGYILKEATLDQMREALATAFGSGGLYIHPAATSALFPTAGSEAKMLDRLSDRELTVLRLVAEGCTNDTIANTIFVSEKTVKSHLSSIFRKLSVSNRTQAAAIALREGILQSDKGRNAW